MSKISLPKLMVIGHGRHGKDTVCEMLRDNFGFTFCSSSQFLAERVIFPKLAHKYNYDTWQDCFNNRTAHREEWHDLIHSHCGDDLAALGKEIYAENDIYCGLRNKREFHAMRNTGLFDFCIWVDRSDFLPLEDPASMSLEPWMSDYVIDNNGTLQQLEHAVTQLAGRILSI